MTARRPSLALALTLAITFALFALAPVACARHHASPVARYATFAGMPVYPHASVVGTNSGRLAMYRSADSYRVVADWYGAHMPKGTHASRDDAKSQATFALFSLADTRTVHVDVADGTVRITMTLVKFGLRPAPTGR